MSMCNVLGVLGDGEDQVWATLQRGRSPWLTQRMRG